MSTAQEVKQTDIDKIFGKIDLLQDIALFICEKAMPLNRGDEKKPKDETAPEHSDIGQQIIDRLSSVYSTLTDAKEALTRFV